MTAMEVGTAELRREGTGVAFLAFGPMLEPCLEVAESLGASVVNMRFIKPLDEAMVLDMAKRHQLLVTVDENAIAGGAGSAVNDCLAAHGVAMNVLNLGLPDRFIEHGSRGEMLRDAGLDAAGIGTAVRARLEGEDRQARPAAGMRSV